MNIDKSQFILNYEVIYFDGCNVCKKRNMFQIVSKVLGLQETA